MEVKPGVKAHPQLLKLFVIAKRLGVDNDKIISVVAKHFKALDRLYIDRLLPLLARNPKTENFEPVYVEGHQHRDSYLEVSDIRDDGICNSTMRTAYAITDGDREMKQRTTNMLRLLGY